MAWEDENYDDREEDWTNSSDSFESPPDGVYQMECVAVRNPRGKKNNHRLIIIDWQVLNGRCQGMKKGYIADIDSDNPRATLGFLKAHLAKCGIRINHLSEMRFVAHKMVGLRGTLQVFTKDGYQNIEIKEITNPVGGHHQTDSEPEQGPYEPPPPTEQDEIPF